MTTLSEMSVHELCGSYSVASKNHENAQYCDHFATMMAEQSEMRNRMSAVVAEIERRIAAGGGASLAVKIDGVGRISQNTKAIAVYFREEPTDDDMRVLHDLFSGEDADGKAGAA